MEEGQLDTLNSPSRCLIGQEDEQEEQQESTDELPSAIRALSVSFCGEDSDLFTPTNNSNNNKTNKSHDCEDNDEVVLGIQALSMALTTAENINLVRNDGTFFSPAIRALSATSFGEESAKENQVETSPHSSYDEKSEQQQQQPQQQQQQQQDNPMLDIMRTSSQEMETVSKSWDEDVLLQRALDNSSGEIVFGESNDDDDDSDYGDAFTPSSTRNIFHDWKNGEDVNNFKSFALSTNEIVLGSESLSLIHI